MVNLLISKGFVVESLNKYHGSTVGVWLSAIVQVYDLFVEHNLIDINPFRSPLVSIPGKRRVPIKRTPRITLPEVRAILAHQVSSLPSSRAVRNLAILGCLFGGALRRSEVCNLQFTNVTITPQYVKLALHKTKTLIYDEQYLPDWAGLYVQNWLKIHPGGQSLFDLSIEGLHKAWKKMLRDAGVMEYGLHAARCTAINRMLELGYSYQEVRDFARHSSVVMVEKYERLYIKGKMNNDY